MVVSEKNLSIINCQLSIIFAMTELFDIINAVNRLNNRMDDMDARIEFLCKYPSLVNFNDYVDEKTACKLLHVSPSRIYQLRKKGEIPFFKSKRKILYPVSGLTEYLANHTEPIINRA
jgi:hypothetical protein